MKISQPTTKVHGSSLVSGMKDEVDFKLKVTHMLSIKGKYKDIECSKKLGKFRTSNRNLTADVRHRKFSLLQEMVI